MFSVHELMEYRMQQQIAHEIYRQQIMQRIPDPFPQIFSLGFPHHMMPPSPRPSLPGNVEAKLENDDLWQQFHKIGTEMIITKSGRRMFPSMRVSLKGLEEETQYCVLLEMVPIGDCRYKFSGSQWVPAGGAEPQSSQRMFLHPDSPATGTHWQSQTILFNKVKLTNNTMDNCGHIVLASMHKYQPRLHIIKTTDLSQLPWAPQQNYVFPETEFIAVTAYQNDRITKLKIDNNPFAKGFRETGQSKCKRKMLSSASSSSSSTSQHDESDDSLSKSEDDRASVLSFDSTTMQAKRLRSSQTNDEEYLPFTLAAQHEQFQQAQHKQQHQQLQSTFLSLTASSPYYEYYGPQTVATSQFMQQHLQTLIMEPLGLGLVSCLAHQPPAQASTLLDDQTINKQTQLSESPSSISASNSASLTAESSSSSSLPSAPDQPTTQKRNNFSISAILAY